MANLTFYGMFDFIGGDSDAYKYTSAEFSALIKAMVGNGVSKNDRNMFATTNSGLNLTVGTGTAFVEGHFGYTDATQPFSLTATSAGISRYDRLVVELDNTNRNMNLKIVEGTAAASPSVPALTQNTTIYQIPLYKALVADGSTVTLTDDRVFTYSVTEVANQFAAISTALAGKSDTSHTHTAAAVGASATTHGHALTDAVITGTLAVAKGGTGATDTATARTNLGAAASTHGHALTDAVITGTLAVAKGGTGATTAAGALTSLGAAASTHGHALTDSGITGTLAVAKGGTGATTASGALTALGASASTHTHAIDGSTITGTLPVSKGGTGAATAKTAMNNLGIFYAVALPGTGVEGQVCLVPIAQEVVNMAQSTFYTTYCRYGYYEWGYTSGFSIGYSSGHDFKGILRFPDLLLQDAEIQSISLLLNRTDTYGAKDNYFGFTQDTAWNAVVTDSFHYQIPSGTGVKTIDLTPYKDKIKAFVGTWCIVANRYTTGEFCSFYGDEDGATKAPRLVVNYENATVEYYTSGGWQKCTVNYYKDGAWVKCVPYYYKDGAWVKV